MIRVAALLGTLGLMTLLAHGQQPAPSAPPQLEPIAEARLLMIGITKPNFDALGKLLKEKPADADAWTFARGQAILMAEAGNLLMMRPPKAKAAQDAWMNRSVELRTAAVKVAKAAGEKDFSTARTAMASLANACNRCHETFRVANRLTPFEGE